MLKDFIGRGQARRKMAALEALNAHVMIADEELRILYVNPSLGELLQESEAEIRRDLPHFSVATLVGSNIDVFHKNPSHQRGMLAQLKHRHKASITVGSRIFDLLVTPLRRGGRTTGFVVEWADAKERLLNFDYAAQIAAIGRSQSIIEFTVDGQIVNANENFLNTMGYGLHEVKGKHHSMFVDPAYARSPDYKTFWDDLAAGRYQASEFRRVGKGGREVWIQGSYNPILDAKGRVVKIVKFATDVTARVRSVAEVGGALTWLAQGDLVRRLDTALTPELDKLRVDFNGAVTRLDDTLRQVGQSSETIRRGTEEITVSADDLSRRTEQQAASLEETAASLDEINATVRKTSEGASHARDLVSQAKGNAEQSAVVVRQAIEAMSGIEASSGKIEQIIGVIDEIAFQTNLLALNAGVEAARAGEAGRGFAVVASEVRALAQRSAEAAKEIKALISASSAQVEQGVDLVGQTGKALTRIVGDVNTINGIVADIASSSLEQARGIEQVNVAVNQMDQVTQQNAAMVEQTTAACHNLAREAGALFSLIAQFECGQSRGAGRPEAAARPARPGRARAA